MKTSLFSLSAVSALSTLLAASLGACAIANTDQDESSWRDAIAVSPSTDAGCFHAAYPSMSWEPVACSAAPNRAFAAPTRTVGAGVPFTVGNGSDYSLETTGLISRSEGTFPHVSGLVSENDGGSNAYTLQLNSNFMSNTAACAEGGAGCLSWAQFVYFAEDGQAGAFMQNWLIGYGSACPTTTVAGNTWNSFDGEDCYINNAGVTTPAIPPPPSR